MQMTLSGRQYIFEGYERVDELWPIDLLAQHDGQVNITPGHHVFDQCLDSEVTSSKNFHDLPLLRMFFKRRILRNSSNPPKHELFAVLAQCPRVDCILIGRGPDCSFFCRMSPFN